MPHTSWSPSLPTSRALKALGIDVELLTLRKPPKLSAETLRLIRAPIMPRTDFRDYAERERIRERMEMAVENRTPARTQTEAPKLARKPATRTQSSSSMGAWKPYEPKQDRSPFGIQGQRRHYTSSIDRTPLTSVPEHSRSEAFDAYNKMDKAFHAARASKDPSVKEEFVTKQVPAYFAALRDSGVKVDGAMVHDMMIQLGYMNMRPGVGFKVEIDGDKTGMFKVPEGQTRTVNVQLIDKHRQPLDFDGLAKLTQGTKPGPGFNIWNMSSGSESHLGVNFIGTSSVGRNRDATLSDSLATGSLANASKTGVGSGNAEMWMKDSAVPLGKYADSLSFVTGHSLGAAIAQDFADMQVKADRRTIGYFAAAPGLSRPQSKQWEANRDNFLYSHAKQDPITLAGLHSWSGREIVGGILDLPVQPGLGNSSIDGVGMQHGAQPATLLALRDGQVPDPTARKAVGPNAFWRMTDGQRPNFAHKIFAEIPAEKASRFLETMGYGGTAKPGQPQGKDHAFNVSMVQLLSKTELGFTAMERNPDGALHALMMSRDAIIADPKMGMRMLAMNLMASLPFEDFSSAMPKNDLRTIGRQVDGVVGRYETHELRSMIAKEKQVASIE
jgi:hypothetical protein